MTAIAPTTIVAAMAELDQEVAALTERRRLLQELLATWDNTTDTPDAAPATPAREVINFGAATPTAKTKKWDYTEVAQVLEAGVEAGKTATAALVDHYGINPGMASYLMKRVRETGNDKRTSRHVDDLPKSKQPTRSFDPQDVAAALGGAA